MDNDWMDLHGEYPESEVERQHSELTADAYVQGRDDAEEGIYNTHPLECRCSDCLASYDEGQSEAMKAKEGVDHE